MTEDTSPANADFHPAPSTIPLPQAVQALRDGLGVYSDSSWALLLSRSLGILGESPHLDDTPILVDHQGRGMVLQPEHRRALLIWSALRVDELGRLVPGEPMFSGPLLWWPPGGVPPMWWVHWLLKLAEAGMEMDPRSAALAIWDVTHHRPRRPPLTYELAYSAPLPPVAARWVAQWSPGWSASAVTAARVALRHWAYEVQLATPSDDPVQFSYTFVRAQSVARPPMGLEGLWKAWQDFYRTRSHIEVPNVPQTPFQPIAEAYRAAGLSLTHPARWTPELLVDPRPEMEILRDWASAHNTVRTVAGGPVFPMRAGSRVVPSIREHVYALNNPAEWNLVELVERGVWWDSPRVLSIYPNLPDDTSRDAPLPTSFFPPMSVSAGGSTPPIPASYEFPPLTPPTPTRKSARVEDVVGTSPHQLVNVTLMVPPAVAATLTATSHWLHQQHSLNPGKLPSEWSEDLRSNLLGLWQVFRTLQPDEERAQVERDRQMAEQVREFRKRKVWDAKDKARSAPWSKPLPAHAPGPLVSASPVVTPPMDEASPPSTKVSKGSRRKTVAVKGVPMVEATAAPLPTPPIAVSPGTLSEMPPEETSEVSHEASTPTTVLFPEVVRTADLPLGTGPMAKQPKLAHRLGLRREEWLGKYHRRPGVPDEYQIEFSVLALSDDDVDRYPYFLNGKPVPPEWIETLYELGWRPGDPIGFRHTECLPHLDAYLYAPWTDAGVQMWDEQIL